METIRLRLFGGFALSRDGRDGDGLSYEKARALLAFLAVESEVSHLRKSLAALLWPDHPPTAALANLRLVLLSLRQAQESGGFSLIHVARDSLRIDPAALASIDAACFSSILSHHTVHGSQPLDEASLRRLELAASLYRGEFLTGFSLADCPEFEAWLQLQREARHRDALTLFARIADAHAERLDHASALPFALRLLELAPWSEDAHRRIMRLLALSGQPGAALAQYENCCRILHSEFGVSPGEATRQLAEQISKGALTRQQVAPGMPAPPEASALFPTERRQVTVLYCDLSLADDADADDALTALYPEHLRLCSVVRGFGGHVVPTYAGGLLAYFGYPQASEHSARHALQAALQVVRSTTANVAVRIGVHTGIVVSGGNQAVPDVSGATTSLAIRLRLIVEAGEVAVSRDCRQLAAGFFEFSEIGLQKLPGLTKPMPVFRLVGEGHARDRIEVSALTPLAGRRSELASLLAAWEDSKAGHSNVLVLVGEAGIGKSRLLWELCEQTAGEERFVRELRCHAEFRGSPFHPIIAIFESLIGFADGEDELERFARLARYLSEHHAALAEQMIPVLAGFLSLPVAAPYSELGMPLAERHDRELDMLLQLLRSLAQQAPVLLFVEDLHWADPSSLELIGRLIGRDHGFPMLAVLTARPQFQLPWPQDLAAIRTLNGLGESDIDAIIHAIAPELPESMIRSLGKRADGIPLYAEELARQVGPGEGEIIPLSLRDLLAARLDGTGDAKPTAQLAASIGRSFAVDLLTRSSLLTPPVVLQNLHVLERAGLVQSSDGVIYHFCHSLIRDAAYQSQAKAARMAAHLRIAAALQETGRPGGTGRPELIAHHLAEGGQHRDAVIYWLRAGNNAAQRGANAEAVMQYEAGLLLLEKIDGVGERFQLEFDLLNALGLASIALEGYASPVAATAHARALTLCEQHAEGQDAFRALWGLWASASSRSGYELALDLAQQLMRIADRTRDPVHLQQARFALGNTQFWRGYFDESIEHLEAAIGMHRAAYHARHVADFGEDVRITAGAYLGWVRESLGYSEAARQASTEAVALARRLHHPFSLGYALTFSALLLCRQRRPQEALQVVAETARLAETHGFHLWRIGAGIASGWARAQLGGHEGVSEIRRCVEETRIAMGGVSLVVLAPLADALVVLGRSQEAVVVIDQALQVGDGLGDHHVDAELYCLKGQALLDFDAAAVADAAFCFQQAVSIAARQNALQIEQRARAMLDGLRRQKRAPGVIN